MKLCTLAFVATAVTLAACNQAYVGTDDDGNLLVNSTGSGDVFINGMSATPLFGLSAEISAMRSMMVAQASANAVLQTNMAVQGATIAVQASTITALQNEVSVQNDTVAEQAGIIAGQTSRSFGGNCSGSWGNDGARGPILNLDFRMLALRRCSIFDGNVLLQGDFDDAAMLGEAFGSVVHITGHLILQRCSSLMDLGTAFSNLLSIGGDLILHDNYGPNLAQGMPFGNLRTIGGKLKLSYNVVLNSVGNIAFRNLVSIGRGLEWWGNHGQCFWNGCRSTGRTAGSVAFCSSAGPLLCPITDHYIAVSGVPDVMTGFRRSSGADGTDMRNTPDNAVGCCQAFCGPNRVNC